ncbi:MAG: hypothetical protein IKO43_05455 [Kiritimatiellae bacterium]|nr:hypothetical protein [Kiritimatiellia bacterium]
MKKAKPRFDFLKRLVSLFTENWGLKLLSLVLAFMIYYTLKPEDGPQRINFERTDERTGFQD